MVSFTDRLCYCHSTWDAQLYWAQKHLWAWLPQTRQPPDTRVGPGKRYNSFLQRWGGYQEAHWVVEGWVCPALDWTWRKAVNRSTCWNKHVSSGSSLLGESQSVGGVHPIRDWGRSEAYVKLSKNNTSCLLYGTLAPPPPRDGETRYRGYCTLRSKQPLVSAKIQQILIIINVQNCCAAQYFCENLDFSGFLFFDKYNFQKNIIYLN